MAARPKRAEPSRPQPFEPFSPIQWQGIAAPERDWMVEGVILRGTTAMLSGDGGLGKSLLMQMLCTAAAIGENWLGLETKPCKTFAMFCEDDEGELHRRQELINRHYGIEAGDLENVSYISRVGHDNILVEFDRYNDTPNKTAVLEQLKTAIRDSGAQLVILDPLADIFGGNEIVRNQVRRFVQEFAKLARDIDGAVIFTAHPSVSGMSSGSGVSGSTAWNNTVRSRAYLTRRQDLADDDEENAERFLKTMKNNYGPYGGKIPLRWERGVFIRTDGNSSAPLSLLDKIGLDEKLLQALRGIIKSGTDVASDINAKNGFASMMRKLPEFRDLSHPVVFGAQQRMVDNGKLKVVVQGPPSKRRQYVRPADMCRPDEHEGKPQ